MQFNFVKLFIQTHASLSMLILWRIFVFCLQFLTCLEVQTSLIKFFLAENFLVIILVSFNSYLISKF